MNALTYRTLATFPLELQSQVRAHCFDDLDELVQQVALALLEARRDDTVRSIFSRARSAVRRFTQDAAHFGRDLAVADAAADDDEPQALTRKQIRARIQADIGISTRGAQRMLKQQIERMRENGDLFVADESGVAK